MLANGGIFSTIVMTVVVTVVLIVNSCRLSFTSSPNLREVEEFLEVRNVPHIKPQTYTFDQLKSKYPEKMVDIQPVKWKPRSPPVIDILIRTWTGDGHFLAFLLRSIEMYMDPGTFRNIIVTYNSSDDEFFRSYLDHYDLPIILKPKVDDPSWFDQINNGGYAAQIYAKLMTFTYSDADYFIHLDSDCLIYTPVNRSHFMDDEGRVYVKRILYTEQEEYKRIWQKSAQYMLKFPVPYETMTRFPMTFPRDLYQNMLKHVSANHKGNSIMQITQEMEYFNEFTPLGAFLIAKMPDRWVDLPPSKEHILHQAWSWGGFKPAVAAYYECLLRAENKSSCVCLNCIKA